VIVPEEIAPRRSAVRARLAPPCKGPQKRAFVLDPLGGKLADGARGQVLVKRRDRYFDRLEPALDVTGGDLHIVLPLSENRRSFLPKMGDLDFTKF